jgi:hypothetical protein
LGLHRPDFGGALASGAKLGALPGPVPKGAKVSYQWLKGGKAIKGATHKAYTIRKSDSKSKLSVKITVKAPGKAAITQKSVARKISPLTKSVTSRPVSISGTAKVGATLKAKPGKWSPKTTKYSYRWTRDGWPISGGTHATYKISDRDAGTSIGLIVTGKAKGRASVVAIAPAKSVPAAAKTEPPAPTPPAPTPPAAAPTQPPAGTPTAPPADTPTAPPTDKPTAPPTDDPTPPPADAIGVPALATTQTQSYTFDQLQPLTAQKLEVIQYTVPTWTYTDADNKTATVPALADADSVVFGLYGPISGQSTVPSGTPVIQSDSSTVAELKAAGVITADVNNGLSIVLAKGLTDAQLATVDGLAAGQYTIKMTVSKTGFGPIVATFGLTWNINAPVEVPAVDTEESQSYAKDTTVSLTQTALQNITYTVPAWTYPGADETVITVPGLADADSVVFALYPAAVAEPVEPPDSASDDPGSVPSEEEDEDSEVPGEEGEGDNTDDTAETPAGPIVLSTPATVAKLVEDGVLVQGHGADAGKYIIVWANSLLTGDVTKLDALAAGNYTIEMTVTKRGYGPLVATFGLVWSLEPIDIAPVVASGQVPKVVAPTMESDDEVKAALATTMWAVPTWTYTDHGTPTEVTLQDDDEVTLALYAGTNPNSVVQADSYTVAELKEYCVLVPVTLAQGPFDKPTFATCPAEPGEGEPTTSTDGDDDTTPAAPEVLAFIPAAGLQPDQITDIKTLPTGDYTVRMTVKRDGFSDFIANFPLAWTNEGAPMLVPEINTDQTQEFKPTNVDDITKEALVAAVSYTFPTWTDIFGAAVPLDVADEAEFALLEEDGDGVLQPVQVAEANVEAGSYTLEEMIEAGALVVSGTGASTQYVLTPGVAFGDEDITALAHLPSGTYTVKMTITKAGPGEELEQTAPATVTYAPFIATFVFEWENPTVEEEPLEPTD